MNEEMLFAREDQVIDLSKGTDDTVDFQKFLIQGGDTLKKKLKTLENLKTLEAGQFC